MAPMNFIDTLPLEIRATPILSPGSTNSSDQTNTTTPASNNNKNNLPDAAMILIFMVPIALVVGGVIALT